MSSSEINRSSPEHQEVKHEALEQARRENQERLRDQLDRQAEKAPNDNLEAAQQEALEQALSHEKMSAAPDREVSPAEKRNNRPPQKVIEAGFQKTMQEVRTEMSTPSRAFSKVIHNKAIEKASDVVGNSVARPNAILSGAIAAFILTLGVYLLAKNLGYPLSGFETIGAFILGWILGLIFDFLKIMITGRK